MKLGLLLMVFMCALGIDVLANNFCNIEEEKLVYNSLGMICYSGNYSITNNTSINGLTVRQYSNGELITDDKGGTMNTPSKPIGDMSFFLSINTATKFLHKKYGSQPTATLGYEDSPRGSVKIVQTLILEAGEFDLSGRRQSHVFTQLEEVDNTIPLFYIMFYSYSDYPHAAIPPLKTLNDLIERYTNAYIIVICARVENKTSNQGIEPTSANAQSIVPND